MTNHKKNDDDEVAANFIADSLNPHNFISTLSYREVITAATISFSLLAVIEILDFYSDERFMENWSYTILMSSIVVAVLLNHVFYRFEHRRSNNLMGRSIFDLLFLVCYYLIKSTYLTIKSQSFQFSLKAENVLELFGIFIALGIAILIFEFLVSLLKYLLKFLRCPVL